MLSEVSCVLTDNNPHMIPTSTNPSLQKYTLIPTTTTTIVSKIPSVRNTSPNPSNYSIPRAPFFKQLYTNTITTTSIQLKHIKKNLRSNPLNSSISISNLQKPTDQQLDANIDNINKNLVSESKQSNKKYSAFLRKRLSRIHIKTTDNTNSNNLQIPIKITYHPTGYTYISTLSNVPIITKYRIATN